MAFGDGNNDIEMLQTVMPEIKKIKGSSPVNYRLQSFN